jgi:hypothetical protein
MGIKKNTDLSLNLTAEEVNLILDGLANLPYKQVYHLIKKIQHQVISDTQKLIPETSKK